MGHSGTRWGIRGRRRGVGRVALATAVGCVTAAFGVEPVVACTPSWAVVANQAPSLTSDLSGVASVPASSNMWAVGGLLNGNTTRPYTELWNGTTWTTESSGLTTSDPQLGGGHNTFRAVVALSATSVWAVGDWVDLMEPGNSTYEAHWNGSTWAVTEDQQMDNQEETLNAIAAVSASDIWAVGSTTGSTQPFTMHYNGTSWSVVVPPACASGSAGFYGVAALATNNVVAVGTCNGNALIDRWNGSAWANVANAVSGQLTAITAITASDIWAVGYSGSGTSAATLAEHYNGTTWSTVATPNVGSAGSFLGGVASITSSDVWAVGYSGATTSSTLTEQYDGTSWSTVASPNVSGATSTTLLAIAAVSSTNQWAVGNATGGSSAGGATEQETCSGGACTGGSLSIVPPASAAFPATALSGPDQTVTTTAAISVSDMRGTGAGWQIDGTSTTFTAGTHTMPTTATAVASASASNPGGNCVMPTNSVAYGSLILPAGSSPPPPVRLYNAAANTGEGPATVTLTFGLTVPANTFAGNYASTWTLTVASGP